LDYTVDMPAGAQGVEMSGCGGIIPSPSTGEGGVGVICILCCAPSGHGRLYENASSYRRRPVSELLYLDSGSSPEWHAAFSSFVVPCPGVAVSL